MKKLISIFLLLSLVLALSSCVQSIQIKRYEDTPIMPPTSGIVASDIDYESMLRYYEMLLNYETPVPQMYIPREGEFITDDGEELVCRVTVHRFSLSESGVALEFYLGIYRMDGTLYLGEELTASRKAGDDDLDGISKITYAMEKYWNLVKALPGEILADK